MTSAYDAEQSKYVNGKIISENCSEVNLTKLMMMMMKRYYKIS